MSGHTVSAFDRDLGEIRRRVAEMGAIASRMASEAMDALASPDSLLAQSFEDDESELTALQREIERDAALVIARRQPVATDLREIIGAMRIAGDLERVGDLARNIAARATKIAPGRPPTSAALALRRMNDIASRMLTEVLDAYAERDAACAQMAWSRDAEFDALGDPLYRDLLAHMMEKPRAITASVELMFCLKNIARIGEHAANIAETVYYMVTGGELAAALTEGGVDANRPGTSALS